MDPASTAAAIGVGGTVIVGMAGFGAGVTVSKVTLALAIVSPGWPSIVLPERRVIQRL
jgi:hypothetical protein